MISNLDNIGYDHQTTVNSYYNRDVQLNLNNNNTIIKSLKKLGYYNIDLDTETKHLSLSLLLQKIHNELTSNWESQIKNKTLSELLSNNVYTDQRYTYLITKHNRSLVLSEYINSTDTFDFYNNLTLKELNYLGY